MTVTRKESSGVTDVEAEKKDKDAMEAAPPDGGLHAWIIVLASFLTNGIIFGIHNCYGILYVRLKDEMERTGVSDAATKACKSFIDHYLTRRELSLSFVFLRPT